MSTKTNERLIKGNAKLRSNLFNAITQHKNAIKAPHKLLITQGLNTNRNKNRIDSGN